MASVTLARRAAGAPRLHFLRWAFIFIGHPKISNPPNLQHKTDERGSGNRNNNRRLPSSFVQARYAFACHGCRIYQTFKPNLGNLKQGPERAARLWVGGVLVGIFEDGRFYPNTRYQKKGQKSNKMTATPPQLGALRPTGRRRRPSRSSHSPHSSPPF